MRVTIKIIQVIVGVLFIVSGLVKANDPLGLAYKMQEFFELWNSSLKAGNFFLKGGLIALFDFLHDQSLALSIIMITLEVVAGVALLIGWSKRFLLLLLLLLIIFFTFLTGYAYLSGKFTNCGCFGDCLPITPYASFLKDVALLILIMLLLAGQQYIQPVFRRSVQAGVLLATLAATLILQWFALAYLPMVDCLPFKRGNNIAQQMKPPPGSVPDNIAMRFIYEKDGKRYEFAPENLPSDFTTYKYIDRIDKVIRKGNAEPKVKGFALLGLSGSDSTQQVLESPRAFLLFCNELNEGKWLQQVKRLSELSSATIPFYVATPAAKMWQPIFEKHGITNVHIFNIDFTVVRTVARTNPTLLYLENGTIVKKYSKQHLGDAIDDLQNK